MTQSFTQRFVHYLSQQALEEPAVGAALRSGLGREPEQCHQMHRYLAPWLARTPRVHDERVLYMVASLIARAPKVATPESSPGDLGDSLAVAALNRDLAPRTCSRYLHLLTRQPPESICRHVTTTVMALQGKQVPVDFTRLLGDLQSWPERQDQVAKQWQRHYFQAAPDENAGSRDG
ncbi:MULTISPECIES: type I-E CRISPR-associated protein Cse2/CasB [unclassified Saccharopolyspora]|uniref:type I-E CRISPR-associated protein Cse2/CasB n=1 Tax=unclassified Saccharopolyspora TaxID=2646250 RepID=UPI001CD4191E|nr:MULTISPECIES: type I-E CRISPR-associated protein Cse2/CasB [unclassified Saccharopolyspora]MCA1188773.1 type I-E CRISPR-associated protein Cse2/CasB [Saccharopolyspora sp. 6T]MCA1283265.1 type I-E CRISPR-associated protein Cse2/CasB [Saccharopolyspora sp. 7B]